MRELRSRHGWTGQRLAEEMTKVGISWDRSVVTALETGRRQSVSVEELLALAYVLSVAPVHLLVPPVSQEQLRAARSLYAVAPRAAAPTAVIREWIRGRAPIGNTDARMYFGEAPVDEFTAPKWEPTPVAEGGENDGER